MTDESSKDQIPEKYLRGSDSPEITDEGIRRKIETRALFSGPLPPPEALARYEEIKFGSADRIITMAENQASHRQGMESKALDGSHRIEKRGQWMAFVLSLLVIALGFALLWNDKDVTGLTIILADLVALVATFLGGRYLQSRERERKWRSLETEDKNDSLG